MPDTTIAISGDSGLGQALLEGAEVKIYDEEGALLETLETDSSGEIEYDFNNGVIYEIEVNPPAENQDLNSVRSTFYLTDDIPLYDTIFLNSSLKKLTLTLTITDANEDPLENFNVSIIDNYHHILTGSVLTNSVGVAVIETNFDFSLMDEYASITIQVSKSLYEDSEPFQFTFNFLPTVTDLQPSIDLQLTNFDPALI